MRNWNWKRLKTQNGYPADEVISALQKEIRRGHAENAVFWAYELCISGKIFQVKLWERFKTIAVEDVGFANSNSTVVINSLYNSFNSNFDNPDDRLIQALYAAYYLAKSEKDRTIDEMKHILRMFYKKKKIPDYALDRHTKRGAEMGRADLHFWEEGAKISPELKGRSKKYLNRIISYYKNKKPEK